MKTCQKIEYRKPKAKKIIAKPKWSITRIFNQFSISSLTLITDGLCSLFQNNEKYFIKKFNQMSEKLS